MSGMNKAVPVLPTLLWLFTAMMALTAAEGWRMHLAKPLGEKVVFPTALGDLACLPQQFAATGRRFHVVDAATGTKDAWETGLAAVGAPLFRKDLHKHAWDPFWRFSVYLHLPTGKFYAQRAADSWLEVIRR